MKSFPEKYLKTNIHTLCTLPANDGNFTSSLAKATPYDLITSIRIMLEYGSGHLQRISKCVSSLKSLMPKTNNIELVKSIALTYYAHYAGVSNEEMYKTYGNYFKTINEDNIELIIGNFNFSQMMSVITSMIKYNCITVDSLAKLLEVAITESISLYQERNILEFVTLLHLTEKRQMSVAEKNRYKELPDEISVTSYVFYDESNLPSVYTTDMENVCFSNIRDELTKDLTGYIRKCQIKKSDIKSLVLKNGMEMILINPNTGYNILQRAVKSA